MSRHHNSMEQKPIIKKDVNDPSYTGPGKWECLNVISANIFSNKDERRAILTIKLILKKMKCKCIEDIEKFMLENNIELYKGQKDENGRFIGIAKWIWLLHNHVNIKLNKPLFEWTTFLEIYIYETLITPCSA